MMYAEIKNGEIARTGMRPKWVYDDGSPVDDARLAEDGWLPIVRDPQHDPDTEISRDKDMSEWVIETDRVLVTFDVSAKPPPTPEDVIRERSKRLAEGFDYDFGDERGVHHIGTTEEDMRGWDEVTMGANAAVALGAGSTVFDIITETGPVEVTALEWQSILMAATAFRQPIWSASFILQQIDPIPDPATWTGWP